MQKTQVRSRKCYSTVIFYTVLMAFAQSVFSMGEIQIGRYSLQSTAPTQAQAELLAAMTTIRFAEDIRTLGEAVQYLLQGSGYRLTRPAATDPPTQALFALPLPTVHRHLGPMPIRQALQTLAGPAFRLIQDPVHRLVSFELCATKAEK